ncbi:MAG TPA: NlpC/P60 family protein [Bacteroidales bacterium]|nr:C40 family peptidase [Bacteroidales bacterium]HNX06091.1 NlpC/P60 family protein [Bacteroidales bacterium]HPS26056.1 NlpC/P60 family protein [Bacteroidales bacterium]
MRRYHVILLGIVLSGMMVFSSCTTTRHRRPVTHKESKDHDNANTGLLKDYAAKLGVNFKGDEDIKMVSCLAGWLNVPYKYGGNTKQGTDCSGLVSSVFKEVYNISMYRSSADQLKNVTEISKNQLKAGDLVFFKIDNNKVSHVGIYLGENKFIHATTKKGVIVNNLDEEYYKKHYYTSGRVIMQGLP